MNNVILAIILIGLILCLVWYYLHVNQPYNERTQIWATLYNIKSLFNIVGFTILVIVMMWLIIYRKEGMTNSSISSTDPMVISQTTAGAIKTIHDQLQPIQITQDILDQLSDAVNNQSDQISTLQTNSG